MKLKQILSTTLVLIISTMSGCIEDGVTTSASDQPAFSTDTLKMGALFTDEGSQTRVLKVYNRHDKVLNISSISFKEGEDECFRLNVDGQSGKRFSGIEIRPQDSIFVLVDAQLPANGSQLPIDVKSHLQFVTNGVTQQVVLTATGQDVLRLTNYTVEHDEKWSGDMPRKITGKLTISEGATLTLEAGAHLYFHDKACMEVDGRLIAEGTADKPIMLEGDRRGQVINGVGFEVMSRQWEGVAFGATSTGNVLTYTTIRNTVWGVRLEGNDENAWPALKLINCTLRNSAEHVLSAKASSIFAVGCEFAEAGMSVVELTGGNHVLNHCTLSNYYLFSAIGGPLMWLGHTSESNADADMTDMPYMRARIMNTIFYGACSDMSPTDLTGSEVYLTKCLLRSTGSDDDNFIRCIWGADPRFQTRRDDYVFDYRPGAGSPVLGAADETLDEEWDLYTVSPKDNYGVERPQPAAIGGLEGVVRS